MAEVILSMPSVVDPSLAPAGRHCLHAYLAATEPYELWAGMQRGTASYEARKFLGMDSLGIALPEAFKRERAQPLFDAVEKALP